MLKAGPGGRTATINRYYSVRNGAIATKHVFAGKDRVASTVHPGGAEAVATGQRSDGFFSDGKPGNDRAKDALKNPAFGGKTPGGFEGGHPGQGTGNRSGTGDERSSNVEQNPHLGEGTTGIDPTANFRYYYHTDHLGSTNDVTDSSGAVYEHLQYFPFGELWADQRTQTGCVPATVHGQDPQILRGADRVRLLGHLGSVFVVLLVGFGVAELLPDDRAQQIFAVDDEVMSVLSLDNPGARLGLGVGRLVEAKSLPQQPVEHGLIADPGPGPGNLLGFGLERLENVVIDKGRDAGFLFGVRGHGAAAGALEIKFGFFAHRSSPCWYFRFSGLLAFRALMMRAVSPRQV